jgi:hypothetical protein
VWLGGGSRRPATFIVAAGGGCSVGALRLGVRVSGVRGLGLLLCVFLGALCWSSVAESKEVHVYNSSFGGMGSGPGEFESPGGVAVNDVTHDVYVVDRGNDRVEEFDSTGAYIREFNGSGLLAGEEKEAGSGGQPGEKLTGRFSGPSEIAVDNSTGPSREDVYVVDRGHGVIDKFSSTGAYQGQLTETPLHETTGGPFEAGAGHPRSIQGIAVDNNGVVWVSIFEGPIYSFSNTSTVTELETPLNRSAGGLSVDNDDDLYFYRGQGIVVETNSAGEILSNPLDGDEDAFRVAVDPVGREVYLDNIDGIEVFSFSGERIESFGEGHFTEDGEEPLVFSDALAVDASSDTVFTADQSTDKVSIYRAVVLPDVSLTPVTGQSTTGFTLNGTVNPEGGPVTSCAFEFGTAAEYATTKTYGRKLPCEQSLGSIGSGKSSVPVSVRVGGLEPETEYDYRLVAGNTAPVNSPTANEAVFAGPLLGGQFVTDASSDSVTLQAPIDPNGADTRYFVEYGPTAGYGSYAPVPPPGEDLGAAIGVQDVSVHLQGLEADTTYHYRFVAVQDGEIFEEPDASFTTQGVGGFGALLDGRAWELVSPANKKGALIELFEEGGQVQAASDGSGVTYVTQGPSVGEDPAGHATYSQVVSRRDPEGKWESVDLTLPGQLPEKEESALHISQFELEYHLFSPDLTSAIVQPQVAGTPPLAPEITKEQTLYLGDTVNDSFLPLITGANSDGVEIDELARTVSEWQLNFLDATPDLQHVVFKTPLALTPEATDEENINEGVVGEIQSNLYEWNDGELQLVNILPEEGGVTLVAHGRLSDGIPPVRLAGVGDINGLGRGGVQRDMSVDGRRVAWTWGEPYPGAGESKLYRGLFVRDMVEKRTVRVGGPGAVYQTMSSDGSRIFFLENGDLYEYEFETEKQIDLTSDHAISEASGHVQELVSDVSKDGSYVYFVASGALADANGGVKGADNLYLLHDTGEAWTTTFIAILSSEDRPSWYAQAGSGPPFLAHVSSRVSPDGQFLAFMSDRSLTHYDNTDAASGQPDEEVYLYNADTDKITCASCNPTGARPVGVFDTPQVTLLVDRDGVWTSTLSSPEDPHSNHWLAGSIPGWNNLDNGNAVYQPRYLSDSGRLFFDSPDALVAGDTNGLEDAYEFEPAGVGSCVTGGAGFSERLEGCVGLVSSGTSSSESAFYDASENGDDVFFATTAKLVGEDYDKGYDVYDAHVCSEAVPCKEEVVRPPACDSGDSCKVAPTPQPEIFGPAPSATFSGQGNLVTPSPSKSVVVTEAQKRANALSMCRKKKGKKRKTCEAQVRKRYPLKGSPAHKKASGKRKSR